MTALATLAMVAILQLQPAGEPADLAEDEVKSGEVHGVLEWPRSRTLTVRATAYSYTGSRTRTGTVPRWGTVAVDPAVIPLGSRLLISGFEGTVFTAEDTGGGVRGNHIDIFFPSYAEAIRFGVQQRQITLVSAERVVQVAA